MSIGYHDVVVYVTKPPRGGTNTRYAWTCPCGADSPGDWGRRVLAENDAARHIQIAQLTERNHTHEEIAMNYYVAPTKLDTLRARRDELDAQIARLAALPDEPTLSVEIGSEPNVVWFVKTFGRDGGRAYTYAAVQASDGLWYATGPSAPKGYSWEQLITWVTDGEDVALWWAHSWEQLS